jgi:hypothetical protein
MKVAKQQLDIQHLKQLVSVMRKGSGLTSIDNFPSTPRGSERFMRSIRGIAREYLPGVKRGEDYQRSFLQAVGITFNGLAGISGESPNVLGAVSDRLLMDFRQAAALWDVAGLEDALYPLQVESDLTGFSTEIGFKKASDFNMLITSWLSSWAVLNHAIIHVDPATSALLKETDVAEPALPVRELARTWPVCVLHDSASGETHLCLCQCTNDINEQAKAESVDDLDYKHMFVVSFLKDGAAGLTTYDSNQDPSEWTDDQRWIYNAFTLARSYPTYIEPGEQKTWHKKPRKSAVMPSVLTARCAARSLMQVVMDKQAASGSGSGDGRTVRPHWRRGHWRRSFHGVRWELDNPDLTVYETDDGRRYHLAFIAAVLVNQAAFLGEHGEDDV